jgi:hypothetical protein
MTNNKLLRWTALTGSAFLLFSQQTHAQALFTDDSILQVRIEAPLETLSRERPDDEYLDGSLSYTEADGRMQRFDVRLQTRGRFRRQRSTCPFPPVRLNFKTGDLVGSLLEGQDKLKLVTHCNTRRDQFEQLVMREYLAYRILHSLTDLSFRTRLLHITYVDTENDNESITRYGFVIEDDDDVGERIGMESLKTAKLNYSDVDQAHANLVTVFQYLIGNTDYSLIRGPADDDCCHNAVPFSDGSLVWPVPYDFDFSGLVDAPYADPAPQFNIRSVRTRVYRGRCSNNDILDETLDIFRAKKEEIYGLVSALPDLDDRNRRQVTQYLDSFFRVAEDEKRIEREFVRECS